MANKDTFIRSLAEYQGVSIKQATVNYNAFLETVKNFLEAGEEVSMCGYLKFSIKDTKPRVGKDPNTLEDIQIEQGKQVRIKAGVHIKNAVK